jgi:hypothetical protein
LVPRALRWPKVESAWQRSDAAGGQRAFVTPIGQRQLFVAAPISEAAHGSAPHGGALDSCGQAPKGAWGMSWRQEALKGVEDCDKLGGVVKQALIPGFLN